MLDRARSGNARTGIFMLGLFFAGYAAMTALAQTKPESKNVELVGYNDLQGRSGAGVEPTQPWVTRPHRF